FSSGSHLPRRALFRAVWQDSPPPFLELSSDRPCGQACWGTPSRSFLTSTQRSCPCRLRSPWRSVFPYYGRKRPEVRSSEMTSSLPLSGVQVVEFTHMVMGPACGLILADLGADIIKVEPPGGDKTRFLSGS